MRYTSLSTMAMGLAALATASPTGMSPASSANPLASRDVTPPKDQEFSLAMTIDGTYVSLTATYLGENNIILQAGRLSVYPGTPTYTNQTTTTTVSGYNTSLVFDLTDTNIAGIPAGLYGLSVPDLGEVYGASASVFAEENYQEFEFDVTDDQVFHQLTAAPQHFYACNITIDGAVNYHLAWGVTNENLSPPTGCLFTNVYQNFNVPGGATS